VQGPIHIDSGVEHNPMSKPAVFISHSSKDSSIVRALSDALRQKTGGAIEIFVSSDGQSIPLGHNWVHSIEAALNRATLMFVLLSPNSVGSQWIYFEAGYSYSQKRQVIPVGILGVELGVLSPPMSLLQGFNVTSPESLDNLLFLINKHFDHSHDAVFTQADYDAIFGAVTQTADPLLQEFTDWIDHIRISVRLPFDTLKPHIERVLITAGVEFRSRDFDVVSYGATYRRQFYSPHQAPFEERPLDLDLDPSLANQNVRLFQLIAAAYMTEAQIADAPQVNLQIFFAPWAHYIKELHRLTAKLPDSGIQFGDHSDFLYEGQSFYLSRESDYNSPDTDHVDRVGLSLHLPADRLVSYDLLGLLRTLWNHQILFAGEVL
jgi:hypothetical protein